MRLSGLFWVARTQYEIEEKSVSEMQFPDIGGRNVPKWGPLKVAMPLVIGQTLLAGIHLSLTPWLRLVDRLVGSSTVDDS